MLSSTSSSEKRYVMLFISLWLLVFLLPAAIVVVIDPYQVFHKTFLKPVRFYVENERFQMAGINEHYLGETTGTDSIIVGSSLSNNFLEEDVASQLGWRALNLSLRSGSLGERSVVMQHALATGKVRRVLFEINPVDIVDDDPDPFHDPEFPGYLYTHNVLDNWPYVFNQTVLMQAFALCADDPDCMPASLKAFAWPAVNPGAWTKNGLHHWRAWMETTEPLASFGVFNTPANRAALRDKLQQVRQNHALHKTAEPRKPVEFNVAQAYLVDVVRAHPETEFHIWFAPVSLLRFAVEEYAVNIDRMMALRLFLLEALAAEPNVVFYGFDGVTTITGNLDNYMDVSHYNMSVQRWVLDSIARGDHRVTPENGDAYVENLRRNVMAFDVTVPAPD